MSSTREVLVKVIDRRDRIVVERRSFKTDKAMRAWLDRKTEAGRLLEVLGFSR